MASILISWIRVRISKLNLQGIKNMTKPIQKSISTFFVAFFSVVMLGGCIVHVGASKANANVDGYSNYSEVNKSLRISEGRSVGNVSSVNGSLTIEDNVVAEEVSSVNGRLRVGENVTVDELSTVNGSLTAGEGLTSNHSVSTVNGKIDLSDKSMVKGNVSTVNGSIDLTGVVVEKDIETVNASISLSGNTHIMGDIIYKDNNRGKNKWKSKNPTLTIEKGVKVDGKIIVEREVDFDFADSSMMDKVVRKY